MSAEGQFEKGDNPHFCKPPGPARTFWLAAAVGDKWTCKCGRLWLWQYADRFSMHKTWRSAEDMTTAALAFFDKRWRDHLEARGKTNG